MKKFTAVSLFNRVESYLVLIVILFVIICFLLWDTKIKQDNDHRGYVFERNSQSRHFRRSGEPGGAEKSKESPPVTKIQGKESRFGGNEVRRRSSDNQKKVNLKMDDIGVVGKKEQKTDAQINPEQKSFGGDNRGLPDDLQTNPNKVITRGASQNGTKSSRSKFHPDGIDWELEEEMKKRRAAFFATVKSKEQSFNDSDFTSMHEKDDDFAFVTAGSHSTFPAILEFIFSIQYFYPDSDIAVYDIGFTAEERNYIDTLCKTEVVAMWMEIWPEALQNIKHRVWRPLLLQFAMAKFGHYVYIEPGRFIFKQDIRDYIQASRKHGVVFGGRQLKHSSFVVTNPHMYTFLSTNERKLQSTPHFEFSLAVIHNTRLVKHEFMRYLVSCALEEYCIAPPGSKPTCDLNLGNNKIYAKCHRYDESAINLVVNRWHNYQPREYLMRDVITRHFDGRDVATMLKVCNSNHLRKDEV